MTTSVTQYFLGFLEKNPDLVSQKDAIAAAYETLSAAYHAGGKLLLCGNGGSAADCEHIVGELMKSFLVLRPLPDELSQALKGYGENGSALQKHLENALPAVSLCGHPALSSAFLNDAEPTMTFAQQIIGLGRKGDVLLAISTSGNSQNCVYAAITAKAKGMKVIALTGEASSKLSELSDVTVFAPSCETYRIQEYHLPIYHCLCAMLEREFFGTASR